MNSITFENFSKIWVVDFEYATDDCGLPIVHCMVAKSLKDGVTVKKFISDIRNDDLFFLNKNSLYVCFYAIAEISCHLKLGWQLPFHLIDLYTEFRTHTNGKIITCSNSLIGALSYFNLNGIDSLHKEEMRDLAIRGESFSVDEKKSLLDYCEVDVLMTEQLFYAMKKHIDLPQAIMRGDYMKCCARIEKIGIPIDLQAYSSFINNFPKIRNELIESINIDYGIYDNGVFKIENFKNYLYKNKITWPTTDNGKPALDDTTFKNMCISYPKLTIIRELRNTLSKTSLSKISAFPDGRNRVKLSPFSSKTGRNQPSTSKFIFGPSTWIRSFIKPSEGKSIAYIDWSQQEYGIAAALSNDPNMISSYRSGDPYLSFAKLAGAVPEDATKASHPSERELYKKCVLAVQYGMEADSFAQSINKPQVFAKELLRKHKDVFKIFWEWSDNVLDHALISGKITTLYGWNQYLDQKINHRSIRNFPMQANGSEILRLAVIFCFEQGIDICATVHDAILIEGETTEIEVKVGIA